MTYHPLGVDDDSSLVCWIFDQLVFESLKDFRWLAWRVLIELLRRWKSLTIVGHKVTFMPNKTCTTSVKLKFLDLRMWSINFETLRLWEQIIYRLFDEFNAYDTPVSAKT